MKSTPYIVRARRGVAKSKARNVYMIEGESMTMVDIASRLGVHVRAARERMAKVEAPVTWKKLLGERNDD